MQARQYQFLNYATNTYGFAYALPTGYGVDPAKQWPLVVQLHGIGEFGSGNSQSELDKVCVYGPLFEIANAHVLPEAIYVQPQAASAFYWKSVDKLITQIAALFKVDAKRIYLMGLSAGGTVAWQTANAYGGPGLNTPPNVSTNRLAALVPMCGQYNDSDPVNNPLSYNNFTGGQQIYVFHAFDDTSVLLSQSTKWINGITQAMTGQIGNVLAAYPGAATAKVWTGAFQQLTNTWIWTEGINSVYDAAPKFTIYPSGGHGGGWSPTFASDAMWNWMFARSTGATGLPVPPPSGGTVYRYVSPTGSDAAAGTIGAPWATLAYAQSQVRLLLPSANEIIIYLRAGTHRLTNTLALTAADKGTITAPVSWRAYTGEAVEISGGRILNGWTSNGNGTWSCDSTGTAFRQLYVGGVRAKIAQTAVRTIAGWDESGKRLLVTAADAADITVGCEILLQQHWQQHVLIVTNKTVSGINVALGFGSFQEGEMFHASRATGQQHYPTQKYQVQNGTSVAIGVGQFYRNPTTFALTYRPRLGESMANGTVTVPAVQTLVSIAATTGARAGYVSFYGISFVESNWISPNAGLINIQCDLEQGAGVELTTPAAVSLESVDGGAVSGCTFRRIGGLALSAYDDVRNVSLSDNTCDDLSAGGIAINQKRVLTEGYAGTCLNITCDRNLITNTGKDYAGSSGIFLGSGQGISIRRNEVAYAPYSGINSGWRFDYTTTNFGIVTIDDNNIHHVMQVLADGGGIYTLGKQPQTTLNNNTIEDINRSVVASSYPIAAIYFDQGSNGLTATGNRFRRLGALAGAAATQTYLQRGTYPATALTLANNLLLLPPVANQRSPTLSRIAVALGLGLSVAGDGLGGARTAATGNDGNTGGTVLDPSLGLLLMESGAALLAEDGGYMLLEQPPTYTDATFQVSVATSKLRYVAKNGNDANPGTASLPYLTVGKAYTVAIPGDMILVDTGIYRERVTPPITGTPGNYITLKGRPKSQVQISGSEIWSPSWTAGSFSGSWFAAPSSSLFTEDVWWDDKNPFRVTLAATPYNVDGLMEVNRGSTGNAAISYCIGQVWRAGDDRPLKEYPFLTNASATAAGAATSLALESNPGASIYVDKATGTIYLFPAVAAAAPAASTVEITCRRNCWAASVKGQGYHWLEGITFEKTAGQYPVNFWDTPTTVQNGAVSFRSGHHNVMRRCMVRLAGSIGLDYGGQSNMDAERFLNQPRPSKVNVGYHLIDQCLFVDNGMCGAVGYIETSVTFQDCVFERNNLYKDFEGYKRYENAGLKFLSTNSLRCVRCFFRDNFRASATWVDGGAYSDGEFEDCLMVRNDLFGFDFEMSTLGYRNLRVRNCIVIDCKGAAVFSNDAAGVSIEHCLFDQVVTDVGDYSYVRASGITVRLDNLRGGLGASRDWSVYGTVFGNGLPYWFDLAYPREGQDLTTGRFFARNVYAGAATDRRALLNRFYKVPADGANSVELNGLISSELGGLNPGSGAFDLSSRVALKQNEFAQMLISHTPTDRDTGSAVTPIYAATFNHQTMDVEIVTDLPSPGTFGSKTGLAMTVDARGVGYKNDGTDRPGPVQEQRFGRITFKAWNGPQSLPLGVVPTNW